MSNRSREDASINTNNSHNVIVLGTKITGNLFSETDFRLDGEITGDIECHGKLVIGPKGFLKGNIKCKTAEILGTVLGDIKADETLILRENSGITGKVIVKSLMIEPNAIFNGSCSMKEQANEITVE